MRNSSLMVSTEFLVLSKLESAKEGEQVLGTLSNISNCYSSLLITTEEFVSAAGTRKKT